MRINDKINEIKTYLSELEDILPESLDIYKETKNRAACERFFEKITEAVVDLAFLVIKERKLKIPNEDKEAFEILANSKIISKALANKLKEAKGMRNLIAHEYGKVDDKIVFASITKELKRDVEEFIELIEIVFKEAK